MRLTIAKKITLTIIGIVVLCVVTMAWFTSQHLQSGFISYLNAVQEKELDELSGQLAQRYRQSGNLEWLRRNPRALRELMDPHVERVEPDRPDDDRMPPRFDGRGPPPRRPPASPPHADEGLGFGQRLSIIDAAGEPLLGPPDPPPGIVREVIVDGKTVATMNLMPIRKIASAADSRFMRDQIRGILLLAAVLVVVAILLAVWLARHLLKPIAALRRVTQSIAKGRLDTRATMVNRDELGELSQHINAMAEVLETNDQQRRKMLADVSHELRTPLTVIRGELEALLDGIRPADIGALESLHAEVLRINKLVDDLHQLALSDTGALHYERRPVDLAQLVRDAAAHYQPRASAAGLTLSVDLEQAPLYVFADAGRLMQLITNLLENSVRYTSAGGTIVVALQRNRHSAELCIEDSAPGVPPGLHERLFERLYRVDQARTRERGGSGLGLAICKTIVDAHQGEIHAMPSALGGIKVVVRLPLSDIRET